MAKPYLESDPRFYNKLIQVSNNVGLNPKDILVVMALESGINHSVHNKNYGGLTQMSNSTLKGLGYDGNVTDFSNEPAYKQLDYIEKHILKLINIFGSKFDEAAQYYVGNFLPVSLKLPGVKLKDPSTIIVEKNPSTANLPNVSIDQEKSFYNSNKGLDLDDDGKITYGDIQNFLNKKRKELHYEHASKQIDKILPSNLQKEDDTSSILNQINSFLNKVMATKSFKSEKNDFTIFIVANDLETSIEFSRILTLALKNNLKAKATSHINKNKVEVTCTINGPRDISKKIVQTFTNYLSNCFYKQTKDIGGLIVSGNIVSDTKSKYDFIDYKTATLSYRKFMTKFMKV